MTEKNNIISREVQRFRQVWLWILVLPTQLFLAVFFGYAMVKQLVLGIPVGNVPMSDTALAIVGPLMVLLGIGLTYLLYVTKLITEVRNDGLYIRFFPFHFSFRKIPLDEIKRYEVRTYSPIKEYGGWGIRRGWSKGKGMAYNASGNRGVQLELSKW